jgi:hypothetical protein
MTRFNREVTHFQAAQMACIHQVYPMVRAILHKFYPLSTERVPLLDSQFSTARAIFNSQVLPTDKVLADPRPEKGSVLPQKVLSMKIDRRLLSSLRSSFNGNHSHLSRLSDVAVKRSGDFASAPLGFKGAVFMESNNFRVALLHRLGFQFAPPSQPCSSNHSHAQPHVAEILTRHWQICKVKGGPIIRHEGLKHALGKVALDAGVEHEFETLDLVDRRLHGNLRPGDLVLKSFNQNGTNTIVDVTYSDPLSPHGGICSRNAAKGGSSADERERSKIAKYRTRVRPNEFVPFAISLYGAPGPHALGLVEQLAFRISRMRELEYGQVLDRIWINLSCITFNFISASILKRAPLMHNASDFDALPMGGSLV